MAQSRGGERGNLTGSLCKTRSGGGPSILTGGDLWRGGGDLWRGGGEEK